MPINETQLNGRIATLLDRMNARWSAYGETHGAFEGNQRQPDILVHQQGLRPVIIENEYLPAHTVEPEAIARLGENLDTDIVDTSGKINAVVALRSPLDLHNCRSHDQVDNLLSGGIQLEYALYTGTSRDEYNRFPQQGFIPGNLKDLAAFISYAAVPEDAIQTAIDTLITGIGASATILREACEVSESTKEAITDILKQDYSDQTLRMTATIMINALVFHLSLSGRHGIPNFNDACPQGIPVSGLMQRQWHEILNINYWSLFKIAVDLLHGIASIEHANLALDVMVRTAGRVHAFGIADSRYLFDAVFQGSFADRESGMVKHKDGDYGKEIFDLLAQINGIENLRNMLKRGYVGVFHHMSGKHLPRYVQEFAVRQNIRGMDAADHMAFIGVGSEGKTLSCFELTGPKRTRQPKML